MTKEKKAAIETAVRAGEFIKSRLGKVRELSFKTVRNIVTDVDKKSEKLIINRLRRKFPDYSILGEEGGNRESKSVYKWVIDPIDGTTNFAHNLPLFCVSIALEYKGEPVLGVVYEPIRRELFYAEKNKGAYLNNKRIYVSKTNKLSESLVATGSAYVLRETKCNNVDHYVDFIIFAQGLRRFGSAALDMCYVACGRLDGFWEADLHPWDTAAGYVIVKEAGGRVTDFSGNKYSHYEKETLASNGKIHRQMLNVLKGRGKDIFTREYLLKVKKGISKNGQIK
ncbi:MAG: hypothetical protein AUJ85_03165 [Elusimicrobia bacterium CG1_02_37_114]|nr:MAG: hypothetical protein AUJ85_03165 [Elusimicrobia bacterium CG1_02_37_114]PIV53125.1 MAG: inositol monophosphatase [Elusimicrobia bacterium CG02_land_8_20_14_3_00_37_13]PIZ12787.1 MAG: inositol monophosphatase [Elusimicrobia bacterium CG_4_10_14_0_8_um_filter_37_32]